MARYNKVDADGKARISEDSYRILHEFPPPNSLRKFWMGG